MELAYYGLFALIFNEILFLKWVSGAFGKVFHGFLTNESDQTVEEVAIKTLKGTYACVSVSLIIR